MSRAVDQAPQDAGTPAVTLPPRPYPGLRPFDPEEWPIFFGREQAVDDLLDRLVRQRLVFVHGDSGSGKSSVVRAGLLAQLEQGRAGPGWKTAIAWPRRAPLWHVAQALARLAGADADDEGAALPWRRALNFGADAPAALAELYAPTLAARGPGCLLIDQFEELFQHARREGPAEARALTEVLSAWQAQPPAGLYLVTTMRSEYLGACARFPGFAQAVNAVQYLLPPMSHGDLLRAVREPARLYDGEVSRELAERLIADAGGSHDPLPLMQHTLMRLHAGLKPQPEQPWRLELAHFPATGGCTGLLSGHADDIAAAVRAQLGAGTHERLVEDLFRALTDINPDGLAIRRPMPLESLAAVTRSDLSALRTVIDAFRADGVSFLTPPPARPLQPHTLIDVGHEALLRAWRVLANPADGWLAREFRNGLVWRALLVQTDSFEQDASNVLAPTTTDERLAWMARRNPAWAERYGGGWPRVSQLLAASAAARDQDRQSRQEALQARIRAARLRLVLGLGLISALAVLGGGAWFVAEMQDELQESRLQFAAAQAVRVQNERLVADLDAERRRSAMLMAAADLEPGAGAPGVTRRTGRRGSSAPDAAAVAAWAASAPSVLARPGSDPGATGSAAWIYLHIADPAQRSAAESLGRLIAASTLDGQRITMRGVELVKAAPARPELRCFSEVDCRDDAPRLRDLINGLLTSPQVAVTDLSARYGNSPNVRPRNFEVWLPPGAVVLK